MSAGQDTGSDDSEPKFDWSLGLFELSDKDRDDRIDGQESSMMEPLPFSQILSDRDDDYVVKPGDSRKPVPHNQAESFMGKAATGDGRSLGSSQQANGRNSAPNSEELSGRQVISRRSGSHRKRPKGTPKRPLSAYNFYFREERTRLMQAENLELEGLARLPSGKISFVDLGRHIGTKWNNLNEEGRRAYKNLADEDIVRYRLEMEEFEKRQAEEAARPNANPRAPYDATQLSSLISATSYNSEQGRFQPSAVDRYAPSRYPLSIPDRSIDPTLATHPTISSVAPGTEIMVFDLDGVERRFVVNYRVSMVTPDEARRYLSGLPAGFVVVEGPTTDSSQNIPRAGQHVRGYDNYNPQLGPQGSPLPWPRGPPPASYVYKGAPYY